MRKSSSFTSESLRVRTSAVFNSYRFDLNNERLVLDLSSTEFPHLLSLAIEKDKSKKSNLEPSKKGKKRAVSDSFESRDFKRQRGASCSNSNSDLEEGQPHSAVNYQEQPLNGAESGQLLSTNAFAICTHVSELAFTKSFPNSQPHKYVNDEDASQLGWQKEEKALEELLESEFQSISEPQRVDMGLISFFELSGRLLAKSPARSSNSRSLFVLPHFCPEIKSHGEELPESTDLLLTCYSLASAGLLEMRSRLTFIALPRTPVDLDSPELPFRLQVKTTIFATPAFFEPSAESRRKADSKLFLMNFIYPSESLPFDCSGREINVSYFYSIAGPAPRTYSELVLKGVQHPSLRATLLPFQLRSVAWLLAREGKTFNSGGKIIPLAPVESNFQLPMFWDLIEEGDRRWFINRLNGEIQLERPEGNTSMGGILAEEPGLGKTLECITLVLLNPSQELDPLPKWWDAESKLEVRRVKTTLIVTPPSLASQWVDEFALHAPTVKVLVYEGWKKLPTAQKKKPAPKPKKAPKRSTGRGKFQAKSEDVDVKVELDKLPEDFDWVAYFNTFDVCVTTYNVLRSDLYVARVAPDRPRREDVVYSNVERPRTPLVRSEFRRVIMDEVQMASGGKLEEMVSLIPRQSSLAVSGTPARSQIHDMIHVLKFLRIDDVIGPTRYWNRILSSKYANHFKTFFEHYAVRTLKSTIKDELTIPQQTRFLVSIELGPVERHVYDSQLEASLLELGLNARSATPIGEHQVDATLLRALLRKLRGICTHPQVGQLQNQSDKLEKPGTLKTMVEVLDTMMDQRWRDTMDDRKYRVQVLIKYAQLQQLDDLDLIRYQHALDTLLKAERETRSIQEDVKFAIKEVDNKLAKHSTEVDDEMRGTTSDPTKKGPGQEEISGMDDEETYKLDKGKGKAVEGSDDHDNDKEVAESETSRANAEEELNVKKRALQHRLREAQLLLHRVKFLQGDVYHSLGASSSASEDAAYGNAEELRRALLRTTEESAIRAMTQLATEATKKGITKEAILIANPCYSEPSSKIQTLLDEADDIVENVLNKQSALLWKWRGKVQTLLTEKLTGDEANGNEYTRSLETQGEAETYLQAYAALLSDRREVLVNERTLLAAHNTREKKIRRTKAAAKAAAAVVEYALDIPEDLVLQPEHEVLYKELSLQRKILIQPGNKGLHGRALKSILSELTGVAASMTSREEHEKAIVRQCIAEIRELIQSQSTVMDKLDSDLALFRKAFNERINYFRQLQEISDSVVDVVLDHVVGIRESLDNCKAEEADLDTTIKARRAHQRFLDHLRKRKESGNEDEDDETCVLCRTEFDQGFITSCAHVFCEDCLQEWMKKKDGKACPVCRSPIENEKMQRFVSHQMQGVETEAPQGSPPTPQVGPQRKREISFNMIDPKVLQEIKTMEASDNYGSKVQMLVQHLLYLKATDPGSKSIVFSAWADSLQIVKFALLNHGIQCIKIDKDGKNAVKKFKSDPNISVLLLHGERENAGLNITCASRVFLLESVVHHGFEVQAIARIDRMGQTKPTEVYCYYAEDTVEKNILVLAARKGQSLYEKDRATGTLDITAVAEKSGNQTVDGVAKKKPAPKKGDFIFKTKDMLAILFPHMYEEEDELSVGEGHGNMSMMSVLSELSQLDEGPPVAGPSRLRGR